MNATIHLPDNNSIGGMTMPCRPVLVFEWCCHGCQQKVWHADRGLPAGWSDQHVARLGPYARELDLCPACSLDPNAVIRAWQGRFSTFGGVPLPGQTILSSDQGVAVG